MQQRMIDHLLSLSLKSPSSSSESDSARAAAPCERAWVAELFKVFNGTQGMLMRWGTMLKM